MSQVCAKKIKETMAKSKVKKQKKSKTQEKLTSANQENADKYEKLNSVLVKVKSLMHQVSGEENGSKKEKRMDAMVDDAVAAQEEEMEAAAVVKESVVQDIMWSLQSISNLYISAEELNGADHSIDFILNQHHDFLQLLMGFCFATHNHSGNAEHYDISAQKQHLQLECLGFLSNILNAANPAPPFNHYSILFVKFKTCHLAAETLFSLLLQQSPNNTHQNLTVDADSLAIVEQIAQILSSFAENTLEAIDALSNIDFIARSVEYCSNLVKEIQTYFEKNSQEQQQAKKLFISQCSLLRTLLQLLNTLSEENDAFSDCAKKNPVIISSLLQNLDESSAIASSPQSVSSASAAFIEPKSQLLELPLLFSSILFNISLSSLSESQQEQLSLKLSDRILATLSTFNLNEMTQKVLADASVLEKMRIKQEQQPQDEKQKQLNEFIIEQNKETEYIQASKKHLLVIQFALELLTNVFSSPESSLPSSLAAHSLSQPNADTTDLVVEEDEATLENSANQDGMELDFDDDIEIDHDGDKLLSSLLSPALASALYSLLNLDLPHLQSQTIALPAASKAYIYSLEKVYMRCLSCLSNVYLVGGIPTHVRENAESLWKGVFGHVEGYSVMSPVPLELVEASVTLLFSMIQTVQVNPDGEMVDWILKAANLETNLPLQLQLSLIGIVHRLAMQATIELNQIMGKWIMNLVEKLSSSSGHQYAIHLSALLNALYDIYADHTFAYNVNYIRGNWNDVLRRICPSVKAKCKSMDVRKGGQIRRDRLELEEAWENLKAFITYKDQETCLS